MTGTGAAAVETTNIAGPAPAQKSSEGAWVAVAASTQVVGSEWRRTELGQCLATLRFAALLLSDPRQPASEGRIELGDGRNGLI